MSIASHFRAKMDVALTSADSTRSKDPDHRRANLARDLDKADLVLIEKSAVASLIKRIEELVEGVSNANSSDGQG